MFKNVFNSLLITIFIFQNSIFAAEANKAVSLSTLFPAVLETLIKEYSSSYSYKKVSSIPPNINLINLAMISQGRTAYQYSRFQLTDFEFISIVVYKEDYEEDDSDDSSSDDTVTKTKYVLKIKLEYKESEQFFDLTISEEGVPTLPNNYIVQASRDKNYISIQSDSGYRTIFLEKVIHKYDEGEESNCVIL